MEVLSTNNLTKYYKKVCVLKDVNMHIEKGDIYGFVGENGAGKTTIIRLISGIAIPSSGSFNIFGISSNTKEMNKAREKMAGVVETPSIAKNLTPLENMHLQALITGKEKTLEELENLLTTVGLETEAIKDKKTKNLSLGMRQRLGLAITMVSDPEFIILDEPMNGLDPAGFVDIREAILNLNKKGVTFLISSHLLGELEKICNKIGFISHGTLLEELSIEELKSKSRRKIRLKTANLNQTRELLINKLNIKEIQIENDSLIIYDDIDMNDLLIFLSKENEKIEAVNFVEESIEDYYMSLVVGGKKNA